MEIPREGYIEGSLRAVDRNLDDSRLQRSPTVTGEVISVFLKPRIILKSVQLYKSRWYRGV